jgi:peptide/nickel transport system substrate-binding protein
VIRPALAVVLVFVAIGCRSRSSADAATPLPVSTQWLNGEVLPESGTPRDGGTLTVRVMLEPATLNYLDDSSHDAWLFRMTGRTVVEPLIELAPDGALTPGLAASWAESADHLTTTLTLRAASFSSGAPFTSADVLATLTVVMDPTKPTAGIRGEFPTLAAWKAVDERTVVLTWKSPSAFALRALTRVPILSKAQLGGEWADIGRTPIGTGPYTVESWERGQRLTLKRRDGIGGAWLDRIVYRVVKDHTAAGAMFEKGEFDVMTNITPALWRALEGPAAEWARRDWHRIRSLDNSYSYIAWNQRRSGLDDVQVRRALAHLYDAKTVTRVIDLELELPTTCPYYRDGDSCSRQVKPIPFDPAAARALLGDAGFVDSDGDGVRERGDAKLEFTFLLPANSVRLGRLVPLLQEQYRSAGIALNIERVETTTLSARIFKRDFDIMSRVWTEFDREQELSQMFHSSQIDGGSNSVGFNDPEADRLIDSIRLEFDVTRRRALEQQLHERLYSLQPYLFMTNRQSLDAVKQRVHGLQPSVAWYDLRRVWVQD